MTHEVESTWAARELPILAATLRLLDDPRNDFAGFEDIQAETGLSRDELRTGIRALESANPPYLRARFLGGSSGHVEVVSERARRELGSWPSGDDVLERLVDALSRAADDEETPESKGRLREAAAVLGGMAREIAVNVISARIGQAG